MTDRSPEDDDVLWTDFLPRLVAWRRFILGGLLVSWAAIAVVFFGRERAYDCSAMIAFPDAAIVQTRRVGIHFSDYRKLESMLSDATLVESRLSSLLDAKERRDLVASLDDHLVAATTNPRQDLARMDKTDTVVALEISYEGRPAERARQVVEALGALTHDSFLTLIAIDYTQASSLKSAEDAGDATEQRDELAVKTASLRQVLKEIESLRSIVPAGAPSPLREVVDIKDGGDRFLPPAVQIVGLRSICAHNEHDIRVLDRQIQLESLKRDFFHTLGARLTAELKKRGGVVTDIPTLVNEEIAIFHKRHEGSPDLARAEASVQKLTDNLSSYDAALRWLKAPTLKPAPRLFPALKWAFAAALLVLGIALGGALWQSRRALPSHARAA